MEFVESSAFWIGLLKIIWVNIMLSGDNAVLHLFISLSGALLVLAIGKLKSRFAREKL
jgi:hypothetical protein